MTTASQIASIAGQPVFRRDFTKADGRPLRLYGYAPHSENALPETGGEVAVVLGLPLVEAGVLEKEHLCAPSGEG